jgi:hypothetical protein
MRKPDGVTEAQWAKWKEVTKQSDAELQNSFDRVARINLQTGELTERNRIVKLVTDSKVINGDQKHFLLAAIEGEQK